MSLKKVAGLLVAFGLLVGLIQSGVAAQFTDSVTAQQNISVGTFSCGIVSATPAEAVLGNVDTLGYAHSVTLTSGPIMSSAAGSAPLSFVVKNTGTIPDTLSVATTSAPSPLDSPFAIIGAPFANVNLAGGASNTYNTGIKWDALGNTNLGQTESVTWTVTCNEQVVPGGPLGFFGLASTNAENIAGTAPGHAGQIGPNVTAVDNGGGSITLTFSPGSQTGYQSCFEYALNGNAPEQRLVASVGPPVVYRTNYLATLTDGMWPFKCVGDGAPATDSVTVNVGVGGYVQVRMSFGAEADFRFDWTQFNAV